MICRCANHYYHFIALEPQTNRDALRGDGANRSKLAPALMHLENMSLQSLTRSTKGVGVTDLRDALEGRSSLSNPALVNRAPSVSTLDRTSVTHNDAASSFLARPHSRPDKPQLTGSPGEVRDVLNKLRLGKSEGGSNLKTSFPVFNKSPTQ